MWLQVKFWESKLPCSTDICVSFLGLSPERLKTTEVDSFTALEARSLKSGCGKAWLLQDILS